jgi:outer membrane autotransporter protein
VTNTGTITATGGPDGAIGVFASEMSFPGNTVAGSSLVNTGTISAVSDGGPAYAILVGYLPKGLDGVIFRAGRADSLTLGAGSKLIGGLGLGGGADLINFIGGNHNLTFTLGDLTSAIFTGSSIPYAVSGDRAAAIDPTSFAANTSMLQSTTRVISSLAPDFVTASNDEKPLAVFSYAPSPVATNIPEGMMAYVGDAPLKSQTMMSADGTGLWSAGFAGQSEAKAEGNLAGFRNSYYGGAIGIDRPVDAKHRYGAFLGGISGASKIALNYGDTDTHMGFVGVYARYSSGASFVKVGLQAGYGNNASTRRTNNNLLASGVETATSSFNTWYVSPDISVGHTFALGRFLDGDVSLTPTGQIRTLYGSFGSYSEAGGTDNLRIGGHTVQSVEEQLTFKLSHVSTQPSGLRFKLDLIGGVLGTQRLSGGALTGNLLGQSIQFSDPGNASRKAATAGLAAELTNGLTSVYVAGEYMAEWDKNKRRRSLH